MQNFLSHFRLMNTKDHFGSGFQNKDKTASMEAWIEKEKMKQFSGKEHSYDGSHEGQGQQGAGVVTWDDFTSNTTLHGIKYVFQKHATKRKR